MKHTRKLKFRKQKKRGGGSRSDDHSDIANNCAEFFETLFKNNSVGHFVIFENLGIFRYIVTHFRYFDEGNYLTFHKIISNRISNTDENSKRDIQNLMIKEFPVFIYHLHNLFTKLKQYFETSTDWKSYWKSVFVELKKEKSLTEQLFIHNKEFVLGLGKFFLTEEYFTSFTVNIHNLNKLQNANNKSQDGLMSTVFQRKFTLRKNNKVIPIHSTISRKTRKKKSNENYVLTHVPTIYTNKTK